MSGVKGIAPPEGRVDERALFAPAADIDFAPETLPASLPTPDRPAIRRFRFDARAFARQILDMAVLEWERGALFLLAPVAMGLGVLAYFTLPEEPSLPALGVLAAVLALAAYAARARYILHLCLAAALLAVVGATAARLETWRAGTKMIGSEITTRLTGRVVDIDHLANGRTRLTIDVLRTERPVLKYAPDRVRVSAANIPADIVAGVVVTGVARLLPPSGPIRPGSYDFSFESYFDGIGANGFFFRTPEIVTDDAPAPLAQRIAAAIDNFRNGIARRIRTKIEGPEGEIAAALVVGVRAGIPDEVNEHLRRTGLAHILSISGLHMALVAGSIMAALRGAFALFPGFASRHAVKKLAAGAALVMVAAYLLFSGGEVAAQRSFIMLAVMLVAVLFDRAALTMRNLAISALLVLAVSPHELVGPSFQMSYAATAALVGGYAAWTGWRGRRAAPLHASLPALLASKAARIVGGIVLTAIIAGTATTIYGAWHFQRVSPYSLFANLAATPFVAIVMWAAVGAALFMPFGLDGPFLSLMGWGLTAMLDIAEWVSNRSPIDAIGLVPVTSVVLLTVALLVATVATTRLRLLAVPLAAAGLLALAGRPLPDLFVSEDGRLLGVRTPAGDLAVNRSRPSAFTSKDWLRAIAADEIVKPVKYDGALDASRFACEGDTCAIVLPDGKLAAHAPSVAEAARFCAVASLIVIDDATVRSPCGTGGAKVVTARDLARQGAATAAFGRNGLGLTFAIHEDYRPWHDNRQFSRAARGIAPYQPAQKKESTGG